MAQQVFETSTQIELIDVLYDTISEGNKYILFHVLRISHARYQDM